MAEGDKKVAGVMVGALVGMLVAGALTGLVGLLWVQRAYRNARSGWNLVPVVVAATDIAEGTVVTFDMISQRSIPEQFVTSSVVRPDSAADVVNKPAGAALQAGDPLLWSQFDEKRVSAVLVAARDLEAGATLGGQDLVELNVPGKVPLPGWARVTEREQLGGRKVTAALRKGDPLLWSHLDPVPARAPVR